MLYEVITGKLTAQLGDKGTPRYEQQMDRARFGNLMMTFSLGLVAGMYGLSAGKDDDEYGEPFFYMTGGRYDVGNLSDRITSYNVCYTKLLR